ncbi:MAG TPA: hypothetical protein G4O08_06570 [Anaerolineae bacterium]|nr:hypothetical protein [Anaerolineae bacterium]
MEITQPNWLARISLKLRVVFWRVVSTCMGYVLQTHPILQLVFTILVLALTGVIAYGIGRATGNLLNLYVH